MNGDESRVREEARVDYRLEACCNGFRRYKLGSMERLWYLDEAHKLEFKELMGWC